MTFKIKTLVVFFYVVLSTVLASAKNPASSRDAFDWEPIMNAIIQVESEGNSRAVSGDCCGAMQIKPILVEECNNILKSRGQKKRFTLKDRFSIAKSKEMFKLFQSVYNTSNNVEKAIRTWNGGIHYKVRSTNGYYRKVLAAMK